MARDAVGVARIVALVLVAGCIVAGALLLWRSGGPGGLLMGAGTGATPSQLNRFVIELSGEPPLPAPGTSGGFTAGVAHIDSPAIIEVVTPEGERFEIRSRQSFVTLTGGRVSDVTVEPSDGALPFGDALSLLNSELARLKITPDERAAATLAAWGAGSYRNDSQVRGRAMSTGTPVSATTKLYIQMLPHIKGDWGLSISFSLSQAERERIQADAGAEWAEETSGAAGERLEPGGP